LVHVEFIGRNDTVTIIIQTVANLRRRANAALTDT
jgi:hypothetical protein